MVPLCIVNLTKSTNFRTDDHLSPRKLQDSSHLLFQCTEQALRAGARACTASIAWHEYVRGPLLREDRDRALRVIESRIISLDRRDAEAAATLYNQTGRRRGATADCLIAAAAIGQDAELLTRNQIDFKPFVPHGLRLMELPDGPV